MTVALCVLDLHFSSARSLKEKRMVVSRLKARIRSRFNVSIAEVEHQDLWQRAALAVVAVGSARQPVDQILEGVAREIENGLPGEVLDVQTEYLV